MNQPTKQPSYKPYTYEYRIKLSDTDCAGVMFFARQFEIMHAAYEDFLENSGLPLSEIISNGHIALPIVHAEATFTKPVKLGTLIRVSLQCVSTSTSSFTIGYVLSVNKTQVGNGTTTHVAISQSTNEKLALPPAIMKLLDTIR